MMPTARTLSWSIVLIAVLALGAALSPRARAAPDPDKGRVPAARMRVAVMDFTNAAGENLAHLGKGLQSMLITDLAEVEGFELVERARLGDIRAELDLAQSGLIDKNTAVRIGKLAGATHLVAGSYTVAGARMRIDARLFAVASGKILLAAKVEGEKDAFFELEKDLIKQLVGATGVAVTPRERARLGKIHTADFQAFEKFSQGIDLFDARRYDEAVQALRQASAIDADFELARLTLAEYERLARTMRTRAEAASVAETELARLREDKDRKRETEVVERLFAMANRKGAQHREERVLALALLMEIYAANYHGWEFLRRLEETGDRFAIARTRDWLQQSYWAEVSGHLGEVPPFGITVQMPPTTVSEIDAVFTAMRKTLKQRARDVLSTNLDYDVAMLARRLHLDRGQQAALLDELVRHGLEKGKDEDLAARLLLELAERYQDVLELERSTRQLVLVGRVTKNARALEQAAERMEENRDLAQLLARKGALAAYAREYLLNSVSKPKLHPIREARELFVGKELTEAIAREIDHVRQWLADDYLLIGDQPMWLVQRNQALRTGARQDRYRADEIRYYLRAGAHPDQGGMLAVWGAGPREDFRVRFRVRHAAPRDYWLARGGKERAELAEGRAGRARVSFLFGLRNIDTRPAPARAGAAGQSEPGAEPGAEPAPMSGHALLIEDDGIALARVRAQRPERGRKRATLVPEVLGRLALDTRAARELDVTVEVKQGRVILSAGGKSATIPAPGYERGYLGLQIDGHGYAAWSALGAAGARAK
jgi:TolB-like protein